jgi:hypothetical protein
MYAESNKSVFAGHELTEDEPGALCWHLRHPTSEHHPMTVTVTDEGIMLQYPGVRHTRMSLSGFVGELDPKYLASKFITWDPNEANEALTAFIGNLEQQACNGDLEAENALERIHNLTGDGKACSTPEDWGDRIESFDDLSPLAGYPGADKLIALHARFRETFLATYKLVDGKPVRQ